MVESIDDLLFLPVPRSIQPADGRFELIDGMRLIAPSSIAESERQALARFCHACERHAGHRIDLRLGGEPGPEPHIRVCIDATGDEASETYRLTVRPDRVDVQAGSGAGLFYAIQTLTQLARCAGSSWPSLVIEDEPAFAMRGLHVDVSRGRVPTLDTLKALAVRLAHFKINQLQLYIEHTFAFAFNPRISAGCLPLTPDEIRELDAFCRLHRVELVPSVASFGHMARILSLPEYRHLAEVDAGKDWDDITWHQRTRGLTLDATNPESRQLLEAMYAELLPLFGGEWVNVCCDETYDLGKGRGQRRAADIGVGRLYLEHMLWLHELCARHGKRMMYWGDIIRKYPDLLRDLPKDARILHWDYGRRAEYDAIRLFCEAGLDTGVCPSTSAWARFMSGINVAEANARMHAQVARQHGAGGFLNTDWGDEGHVNMLTCAWHPIAVGAAVSWNADAPDPAAFDRAFGFFLFGDRSGSVSQAMRNLARLHDDVTDWRVLRAPFNDKPAHKPISADAARRAVTDAQALRVLVDGLLTAKAETDQSPPDMGDVTDTSITVPELRELKVSARMCELVGEKVLLVRHLNRWLSRPRRVVPRSSGKLCRAAGSMHR